MYCRYCYKQYTKGYKVKLVDAYMNESYADCCSEECCKALQDKAIQKLEKQLNLIRYQSFQPINY